MGSPYASLPGAEDITEARVGILVAVWDHLLKCKTRHNYLRNKRTNGDFHVSLSFTECIANTIKMGQGVAENKEIKNSKAFLDGLAEPAEPQVFGLIINGNCACGMDQNGLRSSRFSFNELEAQRSTRSGVQP